MKKVLDAIKDWALRNTMKLNAKKTKYMWICIEDGIPEPPSLMIGNDTIDRVNSFKLFFCAGVTYSGEYDACDVTLMLYPHRASSKNTPGHGRNRTYYLWNNSPMLCQLSYAIRSVRVGDISGENLVPSISICNLIIMIFFLCWCNVFR